MLGSGMNLVTTVIGFGMSATFIVFICARLVCARIRSADSQAASPFHADLRDAHDHPPEHAVHGLEPVVVAAIPTVKYSREAFHSREDAQCSICLGDYEEKEMLRVMPTCHHNFHLACIDVWLQKQPTCPICRVPLNDSFEEKYAHSPLFGSRQALDSPSVASNHSNDWLLSSRLQSGGTTSNQEIHEASMIIVVPDREPERGT